jgi:hypothetical protein
MSEKMYCLLKVFTFFVMLSSVTRGQAGDLGRMSLVGGRTSSDTYEIPMSDANAAREVTGLYRLLRAMADERKPDVGSTNQFGLVQRQKIEVSSLTRVSAPASESWSCRLSVTHDTGFRLEDRFSMSTPGALTTVVDGVRSTLVSKTNVHLIEWDFKKSVLRVRTPDLGSPTRLEGILSFRARSVERNLGSRQTVGGSVSAKSKDASVNFSSATISSTRRFLVDLAGLNYLFDTGLVEAYRVPTVGQSELRIHFRSRFVTNGSLSVKQQFSTIQSGGCKRILEGSGSFKDKLKSVEMSLSQEASCNVDLNFVTSNCDFSITPGSFDGAHNVIALVSRPVGDKKGVALVEQTFRSTYGWQFVANAGLAGISVAERRQGEIPPKALRQVKGW